MVICETIVDPNQSAVSVSFNPLNWKQLAVVSEDRVSQLNIETCDTENIITTTYVNIFKICMHMNAKINHAFLLVIITFNSIIV